MIRFLLPFPLSTLHSSRMETSSIGRRSLVALFLSVVSIGLISPGGGPLPRPGPPWPSRSCCSGRARALCCL